MAAGLAIFFGIIVVYAVVAVWLGRRSITLPMFFVVVGALTGVYGSGPDRNLTGIRNHQATG